MQSQNKLTKAEEKLMVESCYMNLQDEMYRFDANKPSKKEIEKHNKMVDVFKKFQTIYGFSGNVEHLKVIE